MEEGAAEEEGRMTMKPERSVETCSLVYMNMNDEHKN